LLKLSLGGWVVSFFETQCMRVRIIVHNCHTQHSTEQF